MTIAAHTLIWQVAALPALLPPVPPVKLLPAPPAVPLLPAPPPALLLPAPAAVPLLADPGPRAVRLYHQRCELDRLLADLAADLVRYADVMLDLTVVPRDGLYHVRRVSDLSAVRIIRRDTSRNEIRVYPPPGTDRHGIPLREPSWIKTYAAYPPHEDLWSGLRNIINRHNAKGGYYFN